MGRLFSAKVDNTTRVQVVVEATYVPINGNEKETLLHRIEAGHSKDFGAKKTDSGSQMYIESMTINDGQNRDKTLNSPFFEGQDKDKKTVVIAESDDSKDFVVTF